MTEPTQHADNDSLDERVNPEKLQNSKGRVFGIGVLLGFSLPFLYIAMNLIFSFNWFAETIFDIISDGLFWVEILISIIWGVPLSIFGVIGAFIASSLKNTRKAPWVGGLCGSILCIVILHLLQLNYICTLGC